MASDIELLREASLFSDMDDKELAAMRSAMDEHTFCPGQNIIRENEEGKLQVASTNDKANQKPISPQCALVVARLPYMNKTLHHQ